VNLPGSLAAARALLADPASFLCFPGLSRPSTAEAAWFEHDVDLPILGRQAQAVVLAVDEAPAEPGSACIVFSASGALVSVSGRWRLENGAAGVRAELALECRVAEDVRRQAVDAYRSRSPLPIRTDADAILTRLVDDLFHEKLEQDAAIYRRRIAALLEPRGAA
jgi:hypothetical protein